MAELYRIEQDALLSICHYSDRKHIGSLKVNGDEAVPATGWVTLPNGEDVVIPVGDMDSVVLHANDGIVGEEQGLVDLRVAATYVNLHERLRTREHVIGVTYRQMANLAVRAAGFTHLRTYTVNDVYDQRIRTAYAKLRVAQRVSYQIGMIYMPTRQFIDTFAAKEYGTQACRLLSYLDKQQLA
jgi:Ser-tRNA(Ala) deacylase AlaX